MIPVADGDIDTTHFQAVAPGVLSQLRRAVEAHRLTVQEAAVERRGLMTLQPGRHVDEQREAGGMGFGEAVFAEALDLREHAFREVAIVTAGEHSGHQLFLERLQPPPPAPGGHRPSQLIRFPRTEAGRHHGQLDHLLLEYRYAQRPVENTTDGLARVDNFLQALTSAQVGMNHVALDGAGANDGNFDHQVVEPGRLQTRQHGHLRPGLHLEDPGTVRLLQHCVGLGVFRRHVVDLQRWLVSRRGMLPVTVDEIEALADGGKHAQTQHIDLHQAKGLQIVFVPLDDRAVGHCGIFDRHEFGERAGGNDEAADVLGEMAGKAEQLLHQREELSDHGAAGINTGAGETLDQIPLVVPPGQGFGEMFNERQLQTQCLADITDRAARPIGDDRGGKRGAVSAVPFVEVLDDFFTPFVFEVDIDIRWLETLFGDEAFEQHVHAGRIDFGDEQAVADRGISRRATTLTENSLGAGKLDDVVNRQEIVLVNQLADDRQFFFQQLPDAGGDAVRPARARTMLDQLAQIRRRGEPGRNDFLGVLVTQFVEREVTARGNRQTFSQHFLRVDPGHGGQRPQMPLTIDDELPAGLLHRGAETDGGHHILQRLTGGIVHVHVAGSDQRQLQPARQRQQFGGFVQVVAGAMQFQRQPQPVGEPGGKLAAVGKVGVAVAAVIRHPQDETFRQRLRRAGQILFVEQIFALRTAPPAQSDQLCELAVGAAVRRKQHQMQVLDMQFGADDQLQTQRFGGDVGPHHACQGALVRNRQRLIAQRHGALHQLFGRGGAAQECEVGQAMQFRVGHRSDTRYARDRARSGVTGVRRHPPAGLREVAIYAKYPWRNQSPPSCVRYTQHNTPWASRAM